LGAGWSAHAARARRAFDGHWAAAVAIAVLRALAGLFVPSQREFSSIPAALGFDRFFWPELFGACGAGQNRRSAGATPSITTIVAS
jgi:hypothetical protein